MITHSEIPQATVVDRESITRLVLRFYDGVRADALLGPSFDAVLAGRWATHLPRMVEFWSTLLIGTHSFSGNVYGKHMALDGITPRHFERWLELWFATTATLFAPPDASRMQQMAQGIARNLFRGYFNDDAAFARIEAGLRHAGH